MVEVVGFDVGSLRRGEVPVERVLRNIDQPMRPLHLAAPTLLALLCVRPPQPPCSALDLMPYFAEAACRVFHLFQCYFSADQLPCPLLMFRESSAPKAGQELVKKGHERVRDGKHTLEGIPFKHLPAALATAVTPLITSWHVRPKYQALSACPLARPRTGTHVHTRGMAEVAGTHWHFCLQLLHDFGAQRCLARGCATSNPNEEWHVSSSIGGGCSI